MALWEYLWAWPNTTKLLLHLNWDANDSTGNGNNWTRWWTTAYANGKLGSQCASFNGSSYITIWNNAMFASTTLSMFLWVKFNSVSSLQYIWLCESWGYELVYIRISNVAGAYRLNFITWTWSWFSDWWNDSWWIPITNFTTWVWYHIWFTQSWTTIRQYVNWAEFSNYTSSGNFKTLTWTYKWWLSANVNRYNWLIDEVIIENKAWTPEQIKKYYTYAKWRFWIT